MNTTSNFKLLGSIAIVIIVAGGIVGFSVYKSKVVSSETVSAVDQSELINGVGTSSNQQLANSSSNETLNTNKAIREDEEMDENDSDGDDDDDFRATQTNNNTNSNNVTQNPVADTTKKSTYKDGTYTAIGSYNSPGGPDKISITLTLKNNIVSSVSAIPMAGDPKSANYQQRFISGYQTFVVGKNIDTIKLTNVSGSSLTPIGFNDALTKIKAQAKA